MNRTLSSEEMVALLFNPNFAKDIQSLSISCSKHVLYAKRYFEKNPTTNEDMVIVEIFDQSMSHIYTNSEKTCEIIFRYIYPGETFKLSEVCLDNIVGYKAEKRGVLLDFFEGRILGNPNMKNSLDIKEKKCEILKVNREYNNTIDASKILSTALITMKPCIDRFNDILKAHKQPLLSIALVNGKVLNQEYIEEMVSTLENNPNDNTLEEVVTSLKPTIKELCDIIINTYPTEEHLHPIHEARLFLLEKIQNIVLKIEQWEEKNPIGSSSSTKNIKIDLPIDEISRLLKIVYSPYKESEELKDYKYQEFK